MRLLLLLITSLITFNARADSANPAQTPSVAAALAVLNEFITAFNHEDIVRWSDTLHYPHVRFAGETVFERYNAKGEAIGRYHSLYIVTKVDGRWGIQARSSLAP